MYRRLTIAGSVIEVTEYENLNVVYKPGFEDPRFLWMKNPEYEQYEDLPFESLFPEEDPPDTSEENYARTQRRRRTLIRQLICENFDVKHSKFVTLTFDNKRDYDITDVKTCNIAFDRFLKRIKRRYPGMKHIAVIEFQDKNDRGAVHYHMICNLPYIAKSILAQIWAQGFVKINDIDKVDNLGAYVTKYMSKELKVNSQETIDKRLQRLKAYNCSKGLKRPTVLRSWVPEENELIRQIEVAIKEKSPVYCSEYTSEKCGKVSYKQYNNNRPDIKNQVSA